MWVVSTTIRRGSFAVMVKKTVSLDQHHVVSVFVLRAVNLVEGLRAMGLVFCDRDNPNQMATFGSIRLFVL